MEREDGYFLRNHLGVLGAETQAHDLKMSSSQVSKISAMATMETPQRIIGISGRESGDFRPLPLEV